MVVIVVVVICASKKNDTVLNLLYTYMVMYVRIMQKSFIQLVRVNRNFGQL